MVIHAAQVAMDSVSHTTRASLPSGWHPSDAEPELSAEEQGVLHLLRDMSRQLEAIRVRHEQEISQVTKRVQHQMHLHMTLQTGSELPPALEQMAEMMRLRHERELTIERERHLQNLKRPGVEDQMNAYNQTARVIEACRIVKAAFEAALRSEEDRLIDALRREIDSHPEKLYNYSNGYWMDPLSGPLVTSAEVELLSWNHIYLGIENDVITQLPSVGKEEVNHMFYEANAEEEGAAENARLEYVLNELIDAYEKTHPTMQMSKDAVSRDSAGGMRLAAAILGSGGMSKRRALMDRFGLEVMGKLLRYENSSSSRTKFDDEEKLIHEEQESLVDRCLNLLQVPHEIVKNALAKRAYAFAAASALALHERHKSGPVAPSASSSSMPSMLTSRVGTLQAGGRLAAANVTYPEDNDEDEDVEDSTMPEVPPAAGGVVASASGNSQDALLMAAATSKASLNSLASATGINPQLAAFPYAQHPVYLQQQQPGHGLPFGSYPLFHPLLAQQQQQHFQQQQMSFPGMHPMMNSHLATGGSIPSNSLEHPLMRGVQPPDVRALVDRAGRKPRQAKFRRISGDSDSEGGDDFLEQLLDADSDDDISMLFREHPSALAASTPMDESAAVARRRGRPPKKIAAPMHTVAPVRTLTLSAILTMIMDPIPTNMPPHIKLGRACHQAVIQRYKLVMLMEIRRLRLMLRSLLARRSARRPVNNMGSGTMALELPRN